MKRCPICSRVYADESFRFCLDDGAGLITADNRKTESFEVPTQVVERPAPPKKFRWAAFSLVVGTVVLVILGLSAATLFFALRGGKTNTSVNSPDNTSVPSISTPLFSFDDEAEIKNLMEKVSVAFVKSDAATLDHFMADEYREEDSNGVKATKKDILKPQTVGERVSLRYSDLKVAAKNDKATVTGTGESQFRILGTLLTQRFTFKSQLVKRDGRWQGVYSYTEYVY